MAKLEKEVKAIKSCFEGSKTLESTCVCAPGGGGQPRTRRVKGVCMRADTSSSFPSLPPPPPPPQNQS
jgi:hypothetical protein